MPPTSHRRRGWLILGGTILGMLAVVLLVGAWWYHSSGDLERIRTEARAANVPITWNEVGLVLSPPEVIERYERIGKLSASLKAYESVRTPPKGSTKYPDPLKAYHPIPPPALEHHASLDPALLSQFLVEIDLLPEKPIILRTRSDVFTKRIEINQTRNVSRLLGERILLSPRADLVQENRRLLRLFTQDNPRNFMDFIVHMSCLNAAMNSASGRFFELRADDPGLAEVYEHLADDLDRHLITSLEGTFIEMLDAVENRPAAFSGYPWGSPSWWEDLLSSPRLRCGRYLVLRMYLDWITSAKIPSSPSDLVNYGKAIEADIEHLRWWWPSEALAKVLCYEGHYFFRMTSETQVRLRLLAAELRGQPWPIDPYDPTGRPLRRFERDGQLMGAYSVHTDGLDDGGKRGDRYYALYGPLEPPSPETPTTP